MFSLLSSYIKSFLPNEQTDFLAIEYINKTRLKPLLKSNKSIGKAKQSIIPVKFVDTYIAAHSYRFMPFECLNSKMKLNNTAGLTGVMNYNYGFVDK